MGGTFLFTDFDETLLPKNAEVDRESLARLENLIKRRGYIYSWISGANYEYLVRRSKNVVSEWPRFISSSLGSELHIHTGAGKFAPLHEWQIYLEENGVSEGSLGLCVDLLHQEFSGIELQRSDFQGKYKRSFYYPNRIESDILDKFNLMIIQFGYRTVVTKCSPMSGDPDGYYDVDLLPLSAGKGMSVEFIKRYCRYDGHVSFGFGDSENDLEMLSVVDYPFWVGNSQIQGSRLIRKVEGFYTCGIYQAIAETELEH